MRRSSDSLEEFVSLLWTGAYDRTIFDTPLHVIGGESAPGLPILNRMQSILPLVAARDELAADLTARGAASTGWRIVNLLTSVAAETQDLEPTVEETLARVWAPSSKKAVVAIREAIMAAARGRDTTTTVARHVAGTGVNPYGVVVAALAALQAPPSRASGVRLPKDAALVLHALGRSIAAVAVAIKTYETAG
ncbi:MAG TPA: hypothetical protein VND45_15910 [Thermoanaerobaculia bacterium]|nr:hypothetical protein [Thermoanaerobaculia bacterium]